jgi:glutamine synthetase
MDEKARAKAGIISLPGSLYEAIQELSKSKLVRNALGDHILDKFIENKKKEWDAFRIQVSKYEIDTYLPVL